jgi:hypothetical protein
MTRHIVVLFAAALALAACDKGTPSATATANTSLGAQATASPTPGATATASPTAKASPSTAPPTGPRIEYFRIKTAARCQSHGPSVTYPGSVELEWKVAGGPTQVTISVDGPGIYNTYSIEHAESYDFSCTETSGATQKHTYLLKVPGYPSLQQAIVAQAKYL